MKKFIFRIIIFLFFAFLVVEVYIRVNHLTNDIPRRQIDKDGIQKYIPFQKGKWSKGAHGWSINKEGWPGILPKSYDNLITLVGDSHIENFMNPEYCSLGYFLNASNTKYNFFEAGRSGVTLIEALEISKSIQNKYKPIKCFVFVKQSDFRESIMEFGRKDDVTQFCVSENKVISGKLKAPFLKLILYNVKSLYYFRNTFDFSIKNKTSSNKIVIQQQDYVENEYFKLLKYISKNYETDKIVFFLHPETDDFYFNLLKKSNLNVYQFKTKNDNKSEWGVSENDLSHWGCKGFQEASLQILNYLAQNY